MAVKRHQTSLIYTSYNAYTTSRHSISFVSSWPMSTAQPKTWSVYTWSTQFKLKPFLMHYCRPLYCMPQDSLMIEEDDENRISSKQDPYRHLSLKFKFL
uniref:Uncharacterized protein n=1 Tax=Octopus bimaculoides TaxID=37653 RepID=A0A0L8HL46_OCTBM